jgi:hypothetical protein
LHLFSASPELVGFGQNSYQRRSEKTSLLLQELFEKFPEGFAMSYTFDDFKRDTNKKYFQRLSPEDQQEVIQSAPLNVRLAGLSPEQIQQYLDELNAGRPDKPRKSRRKK